MLVLRSLRLAAGVPIAATARSLHGSSPGGFDSASFIREVVQDHPIVIFSKTTCGYCAEAKKFLKSHQLPYHAIELNLHDHGPAIQDELRQQTGQRTVPNIFVGGAHLGGSSDLLNQYRSGQLKTKLAAVDLQID